MRIRPFYSMKKKSFRVLLPPASCCVACFNDLQNKRAFFFSSDAYFFPHRRKQDLLEHYSLFSLIGDKLINHFLTLTTYNVLFEVRVAAYNVLEINLSF